MSYKEVKEPDKILSDEEAVKYGRYTKAQLEDIIGKIIDLKKEKFVGFFNTSKSISLVRHQLELLPGVGKKHMLEALDERAKKPFESFEDIQNRVKGITDAKKSIVKRIVEELETPEDKHYLFVRQPAEPRRPYYGGGYSGSNSGFASRDNFQRRPRY